MDSILKLLTDNSVLVIVGIVTGILIRYVPVIGKIPNWVTPYLNALVLFFGAWAVPPAEAGILGDIASKLGVFGQLVGSIAIASVQSAIYETFLHHPIKVLEAKGALKKQ